MTMLTDQDPQVLREERQCLRFHFLAFSVAAPLNHLHVELARSIHRVAAHASVRFAWHVFYLNIVLCVSFAPAPKEEQHQAKQDNPQEGDEAHRGRDDQRLYVKREWDIVSCTISTSFYGLVGDKGKSLVRLVRPVG